MSPQIYDKSFILYLSPEFHRRARPHSFQTENKFSIFSPKTFFSKLLQNFILHNWPWPLKPSLEIYFLFHLYDFVGFWIHLIIWTSFQVGKWLIAVCKNFVIVNYKFYGLYYTVGGPLSFRTLIVQFAPYRSAFFERSRLDFLSF